MPLPMQSLRGKIIRILSRKASSRTATMLVGEEMPLRAELFSAYQMKQHGKVLAEVHRLNPGGSHRSLITRLEVNEGLLLEVYRLLSEDVKGDRRITPAGEWLLDNFYLIEEHIRTAKRHFPKGYSKELPQLLNGELAGFPRVYDIALETISHGDGRVDPENLSSFVASYQSVKPLKIGELWAIPIMLRLALMENLRRVASRIAMGRMDCNLAEYWADRMLETASKDPKSLIVVVADMAQSNPPMTSSFVAELSRRLQGQIPALSLPLTWIEQRLSESGLTIEQLVRSDNQEQAGDQVSISNCIGSLRFLGAMNWRVFVETLSVVEQILNEDPMDVYGKMDFTTRDNYRHVVEKVAKKSHLTEIEIAQRAIQLAQNAASGIGGDNKLTHVGYYLVDSGYNQLITPKSGIDSQVPVINHVPRQYHFLPYIGMIFILIMIFTGILLLEAYPYGLHPWMIILLGLLALVSTTHLAVSLVNWVATLIASPHLLPRMDFSKGIPAGYKTLVVVPTIISGSNSIAELVKALEVRFLANQDDYLYFSLLTDFPDANMEHKPEDENLMLIAKQKIEELNEKHGNSTGDTFFLFHRPRKWNASEQVWMGHERKRGKLEELNGLLRGASTENFTLIVGNISLLADVKYVITLDTDTLLPRDSARQFVGTMAHPLNKPVYDEEKHRVVSGYGILQPRVGMNMPGANLTRYSRMCTSEPGIDPYTRTVSDVYQDLFGEGSFIGKGIYDVDTFNLALRDKLPDNRILSHDLLEGCYVRSGLLSDVLLYEGYPASYSDDVKRRHRWIRGDWQIAQWVSMLVPGKTKKRQSNPLSLLSRWKILDNLRRSMSAVALTTMLVGAWFFLPSAWFWTMAGLAIIMIPSFMATVHSMVHKPADLTFRENLASGIKASQQQLAFTIFTLVCLPYEAFFSVDAILRTLWRLHVSHKHLLEWNPSGEQGDINSTRLIGSICKMWFSPVLSSAVFGGLLILKPEALVATLPILALWFTAPAIAWWVSRSMVETEAKLTSEQQVFLRKLSRKTWAFFETFVGQDDNWLPPDNYQEHPAVLIAHRTSPTNIGVSLLASLCAYDFGTISTGKLIEHTARTLHTMDSMERHHGHFYNWYNTQTLQPLEPLYISSVDSGNLAGYLLILKAGLLGLADDEIIGKRLLESLSDTLGILDDVAKTTPEAQVIAKTRELKLYLDTCTAKKPSTLVAWKICLVNLEQFAVELKSSIEALDETPDSTMLWWVNSFLGQCKDALTDLMFLIPWLDYQSQLGDIYHYPYPDRIPSLNELALLEMELQTSSSAALDLLAGTAVRHAKKRLEVIEKLALQCELFAQMEYDFLYDKDRHLLSIGYSVGESMRDTSYYDLLASEARFSSFVAIAQGKLPQESWFALGRLLTISGGEPILLSWSGSMFEYLMPLLVMPTYNQTLLDHTYKAAVTQQIKYGKRRSVPWGISESGYNAVDVHLNYQYRAFGVPGLGLKRGLAEDLVVAPYATALALMVDPLSACRNLDRLALEGVESRYGFYEAVDYTTSRLPRGKRRVIVQSYMAHHQGMSLLSLAYLLLDKPMQKRFEMDSMFQATSLLLQERIPKATAYYSRNTKLTDHYVPQNVTESPVRIFTNPNNASPELQLLSNGRYHVMVTNSGGGYNRWKDIAVTRWREDRTRDNWGTFCYIRDLASGEFWSTAYQPTLKPSKHFEAIFSKGRVEFRGRDHEFETHTEIAVSPEDDIELRRIRITNRSRSRRVIDVTSYAEVVLASQAADALHPAFSNLFVQTEIIRKSRAIICTRRPRSKEEVEPWMLHLMAVHGAETGEVSYETDRAKFIGRGNTTERPQAMYMDTGKSALSGSEGSVLDPIVSIRYQIILNPEEVATINIVTGIGKTREEALNMVEKYQDRRLADRVFDLAWTHSQVLLRQFNITETDAQLYGKLASSIIYPNASLRASPRVLIQNYRGQSGLWGYAISGDLPIVLLRIEDPANIDMVKQLVQAHAYWRLKGLAVDLVIWNEDHGGYRQLLHDLITGLIAASIETNVADQPGGIFVRAIDQIAEEDRILIQTVARVIISDSRGTLTSQINGRSQLETNIPLLIPTRTVRTDTSTTLPASRTDLSIYNGLGGFTSDGREYVITTTHEQRTPAPWVNVLANPAFGTVISESGMAYTWGENAHEFRLTPWSNDLVSDSQGEAFYLRDEERGNFWSPTPLPCGGSSNYVTRHGFGYSVFEHTERGIRTELWVYVAIDASIKFSVLKVFNENHHARHLSVTGYVEWVLGDMRSRSAMHLITEIDLGTGAILARNPYNTEFPERTAFLDVDETSRSITCDRTEFLGRNGSLASPAAMLKSRLSGKVGAALDPCAAIQVSFELEAGQDCEIIFRLGVGVSPLDARNLINRYRGQVSAREVLNSVWQYWNHMLGAINVQTPDQSLNVMANGWLLYQTVSCRLWGRSASYQSGGAYGFRDQLQDVMALVHTEPSIIREHILRCVAHQFPEGDVQHWWHPPTGRGVRTNCSDDYLWLPLTTCRYIHATGDYGVLEEKTHFIQGRPLSADEDSYYDLPRVSELSASLYEHCVLAIQKGLKYGIHGLPLIGSGDWNDGMNMVGNGGSGESVWLAFFTYDVLMCFTTIARKYHDPDFADLCIRHADTLRSNIETHGWDGEWYRRAYFDNGTPLGSKVNAECQIDSIAQSWSVLSGAGEDNHALTAMQSLDKRLVRRESGLIQLLDPPFDTSDLDPGYIKGYVPGVRENGGQYTHAAIWAIMAFAKLGDRQRACELFSMINPVNHARTAREAGIYKVEPYVVAADVYAVPPHTGMGGWTWYTGSAAWMYRLIMESLLGLRLEVDKLYIEPCLPEKWEGFQVHYRFQETVFHVTVILQSTENGMTIVNLDGNLQEGSFIPLVNDLQEHWVEVTISLHKTRNQ